MKILSAKATNFGSYKELDFKFENQGLTLISGPTGSGKSTLCDLIPWVLFGRTAKNGAVDEVISWGSTEGTRGRIVFDTGLVIERSRAPNDLWFNGGGSSASGIYRGKDVSDTQRLINSILGYDLELYLSGSYFHEFSQTAQFFTTTAKNRRLITEQLADLSLPTQLTASSAEYRKELKSAIETFTLDLNETSTTLAVKQDELKRTAVKVTNWNLDKDKKINTLQEKNRDFEENQKATFTKINVAINANLFELKALATKVYDEEYFTRQINSLDKAITKLDEEVCITCGSSKHNTKKVILVRDRQKLLEELSVLRSEQKHDIVLYNQLTKTVSNLQEQLSLEKNRENTYLDQITQLSNETNPYDIETIKTQVSDLSISLVGLKQDLNYYKTELSDLELLGDVLADFRGLLVKSTIKDLEKNTNKLLVNHFDSEIQVNFEIDTDKLEVTILKDSNLASFTQLSKGQRCLLKLCFGVSVMEAVANHHSVDFTTLFFDEALDGLSEPLKEKAFGLFSLLETKYENIFVVDHSESLKACFNNRIDVTLVDGESQIG